MKPSRRASKGRPNSLNGKAFILATGSFVGGGLTATREAIIENVFNLPVHVPGPRETWFDNDYFSFNHGIGRAGIIADSSLRPAGSPLGKYFCVRRNPGRYGDIKKRLRSRSGVGNSPCGGEILHGVYSMNFEHCIRCTICVENCPVFRVNPEFPGPKQAGPDAQRFRSDREKAEDEWVLLCSQCKRCEMACPCGVEPAQIILKAQQRYGLEHPQTPAHLLFANNYYLSALGSLTAPIANMIAATKIGKESFSGNGNINLHSLSRSFVSENCTTKRKT